MIDRFDLVTKSVTAEERRKLFASFMFILKGLPHQVLRDYWEKETEKRTLLFFQLVVLCLEEFEVRTLPTCLNSILTTCD